MNRQKFIICALFLTAFCGLAWIVNSGFKEKAQKAKRTVKVYCAAGMRAPLTELSNLFEELHNVKVVLSFGGSGDLLSKLELLDGDIFIPADELYLQKAQDKGMLITQHRLAKLTPSLISRSDNPKNIGLSNLKELDISVALADQTAAIGVTSAMILTDMNILQEIKRGSYTTVPTVVSVANQVKVGAVDAGIVWSALEGQFPELKFTPIHAPARSQNYAAYGLLKKGAKNTAANEFIQFLKTPVAKKVLSKHGL